MRNTTPDFHPEIPNYLAIIVWFSLCAGFTGIAGLALGFSSWFDDLESYKIVGSLFVGGGVAGAMLRWPLERAVNRRRRAFTAFLGTVVAVIALELGATLTLLLLPEAELPWLAVWALVPVFALPALVIAGPLSGLGLLAIARFFSDSRKESR